MKGADTMKSMLLSQVFLFPSIYAVWSCGPIVQTKEESVQLSSRLVSAKLNAVGKKATFVVDVGGTPGALFDAAIAPTNEITDCSDNRLDRQRRGVIAPAQVELSASYDSEPAKENRLICLFAKAKDGSDLSGALSFKTGLFAPDAPKSPTQPEAAADALNRPPQSVAAPNNAQPEVVQPKPGPVDPLLKLEPSDPTYCEVIPLADIESRYDLTDKQIVYHLKSGKRYPLVFMNDFGTAGKTVGVEVARDAGDPAIQIHDKVVISVKSTELQVDCGDKDVAAINKNRVLITDVALNLYKLYTSANSEPQCVLEVGNHLSYGGPATAPDLPKKVIAGRTLVTGNLFDSKINSVTLIRELSGIKCQASLSPVNIGPGSIWKENEIVFELKVPDKAYTFKQRVLRN